MPLLLGCQALMSPDPATLTPPSSLPSHVLKGLTALVTPWLSLLQEWLGGCSLVEKAKAWFGTSQPAPRPTCAWASLWPALEAYTLPSLPLGWFGGLRGT